jgi:hypothetical protein
MNLKNILQLILLFLTLSSCFSPKYFSRFAEGKKEKNIAIKELKDQGYKVYKIIKRTNTINEILYIE